MTFDWSGLTQDAFEKYRLEKIADNQKDLNDPGAVFRWHENDYIGCARVGELCFDLLLRLKDSDDENSPMVLTFDCYAGGVIFGTEPYSYSRTEPNWPYEDADGADFPTDCTEYDYEAFCAFAEQEFIKFINNSGRDLRALAEKPLHIW